MPTSNNGNKLTMLHYRLSALCKTFVSRRMPRVSVGCERARPTIGATENRISHKNFMQSSIESMLSFKETQRLHWKSVDLILFCLCFPIFRLFMCVCVSLPSMTMFVIVNMCDQLVRLLEFSHAQLSYSLWRAIRKPIFPFTAYQSTQVKEIEQEKGHGDTNECRSFHWSKRQKQQHRKFYFIYSFHISCKHFIFVVFPPFRFGQRDTASERLTKRNVWLKFFMMHIKCIITLLKETWYEVLTVQRAHTHTMCHNLLSFHLSLSIACSVFSTHSLPPSCAVSESLILSRSMHGISKSIKWTRHFLLTWPNPCVQWTVDAWCTFDFNSYTPNRVQIKIVSIHFVWKLRTSGKMS